MRRDGRRGGVAGGRAVRRRVRRGWWRRRCCGGRRLCEETSVMGHVRKLKQAGCERHKREPSSLCGARLAVPGRSPRRCRQGPDRHSITQDQEEPTCHLRHEGLKLGKPLAAPAGVVKTCSVGRLFGAGARRGSSLGGYVTRGTESKRRWRGRGIGGIQSLLCADVPDSTVGPELGVGVGWVDVIALLENRGGYARWRCSQAQRGAWQKGRFGCFQVGLQPDPCRFGRMSWIGAALPAAEQHAACVPDGSLLLRVQHKAEGLTFDKAVAAIRDRCTGAGRLG